MGAPHDHPHEVKSSSNRDDGVYDSHAKSKCTGHMACPGDHQDNPPKGEARYEKACDHVPENVNDQLNFLWHFNDQIVETEMTASFSQPRRPQKTYPNEHENNQFLRP